MIQFDKLIRKVFPTRIQFKKWSLIAKASYIGVWLSFAGILFGAYSHFFPRENQALKMAEMEAFGTIVLLKVLENSSLCCDIKTGKFLVFLPFERELQINAKELIGTMPSSVDKSLLKFSFTTDPKDSIRIFNCNDIMIQDIDIYFFNNRKVFCSKPAKLDLRDPLEYCSLPLSK